DTGPEVVMGSTRLKAGTAEKMVLNMLSTGSMVGLGKTYRNLMVDMRPTNRKLRNRAIQIVSLATGVGREQAKQLLIHAQGRVKVAVAMQVLGTSAREATKRLQECGGVLSRL
ncbi:N-acetylmuramic acid 6-phosphate etherase, partial [Sulfobacillus sp. DSM 109850]|nr:N-acetylmuramic acid 6-phosphate etherase [Sulfobacillus harzensis]